MLGAANNFHLRTKSGWRLTWPADNSSSLFKYSIQLGWPWCLASQHFINSSQLADLGLDQPTTSQSFPFRIGWPWYLARPITSFLSQQAGLFDLAQLKTLSSSLFNQPGWPFGTWHSHHIHQLFNGLAFVSSARQTFIFSHNRAGLLDSAQPITPSIYSVRLALGIWQPTHSSLPLTRFALRV